MFCLLCYDPSYFDFVSLGLDFSSWGFISPFFPRLVLETFIECLDFYVFLEKNRRVLFWSAGDLLSSQALFFFRTHYSGRAKQESKRVKVCWYCSLYSPATERRCPWGLWLSNRPFIGQK